MKKRNSKRKKSKLLIVIIILVLFLVLKEKVNFSYKFNIGESTNRNYNGIGEIEENGKDGYNSIFITEEQNKKEYIEYIQGANASWAQKAYWGGTMEENGCGITCIAIIASGYGKNITPEDLRIKYSPHLDGEDMSDALKNMGIENSDFYFSEFYFRKDYILEHLEENKPILICVWDKPDTRWTEKSHYMVLLATAGKNKIYVSNPNGEKQKSPSGWYSTEKILPYIAKAMFIEE